jgi:hypothetical protein
MMYQHGSHHLKRQLLKVSWDQTGHHTWMLDEICPLFLKVRRTLDLSIADNAGELVLDPVDPLLP